MKKEKLFDFTIAEGFKMVIDNLQDNENKAILVKFLEDRIAKQNAKATSAKKEKTENSQILDLIIQELSKENELTLSELLKTESISKFTYVEKSEVKNITSSKLNAIIQKELFKGKNEDGEKIPNPNARIERLESGKKITFKLK